MKQKSEVRSGKRETRSRKKEVRNLFLTRFRNLKAIFLIAILSLFLGCTTLSDIKESPTADDIAVITDIRIEDNRLVVTSNKNFTYTIYSTEDPYKTTLEIPDMTVGDFNNKITSDRSGITEIIPQQIASPKLSVKIDIILQNPSRTLVPVYEDNKLELIIEAETIVGAEESVAALETGEAGAEESVAALETGETEAEEPVAALLLDGGESAFEGIPIPESDISSISRATEISSIEIKQSADAVLVLITGNGTMMPNVFPLNERIVVDVPDVSMNAQLPPSGIMPLKGIRAGRHKNRIRLVLDLKEKTNFDVTAIGSSILISLQEREAADLEQKEVVAVQTLSEVSGKEEIIPEPEPQEIVKGKYSGKRISLDFQDADIIPIFRLLADVSGYNIVVNPDIKGRITLKLINVPWDQALELILRTFSLSKVAEGNIIRVVPTNVVAKELTEIAKAKKARAEAGELKTKIFPVNYADLSKLKTAINTAKVLSSRGSVTLDERGSSLIINDIDANLKKVGALISDIDQEYMQARQVMIEAKIVEINVDYTKELGIQWGANYSKPRAGDTTTIGGTTLSGGTGVSGENYLVNLPAAAGAGSGGAIGFGYINHAFNFALDIQLSALEKTDKGRVLSNPKIMTMNNEEAKITQGKTIYLATATVDKISYQAIEALLSLTVTPRIAPGGAILMDLNVTKDEPGGVTEGGINILKNTIDTTVLVNNTDTIVIGGVFKSALQKTDFEVPWFAKIPFVGWLFKKKTNVQTKTELLIFITPTIVEFASLK